MNDPENKYYCDDSLKSGEDEKWKYLLNYAFEIAEFVEFNVLYSNQEITPELKALSNDLVEKSKRNEKIYSNGNYYVRYVLSDKMKSFISSKKYEDWRNYNYEDINFYTKTHEIL